MRQTHLRSEHVVFSEWCGRTRERGFRVRRVVEPWWMKSKVVTPTSDARLAACCLPPVWLAGGHKRGTGPLLVAGRLISTWRQDATQRETMVTSGSWEVDDDQSRGSELTAIGIHHAIAKIRKGNTVNSYAKYMKKKIKRKEIHPK
ncbi:hypothetical protein C2845_PM18G09530 [Panicum miliaceum]|uniref:Uncharacterized protein n=1 Tax=Panicum miliaceum TaxID=4540 RepID=A0A3L6PHA3_PANMI|nr:hypothetical protein C2845_PM18G09530 [Panicum miliaceum]